MTREELKEHCKNQIKMCDIWAIRKSEEPHGKIYEEHKLILKLLEREPRWIPVSERLPNHDEYIKNNGLFNVSDGNRSYSEWFDIYDKQKFGEHTMSGFRVDYAVTAWMPLPEPYESQESGENYADGE